MQWQRGLLWDTQENRINFSFDDTDEGFTGFNDMDKGKDTGQEKCM